MHTKCSDICSCLAADPEDTEMALIVELQEFEFVNGTDTQLTLDSRDQRRTLEERTGQSLHGAVELLFGLDLVVQSQNTDVFFSCTLLRLDEASGAIDADNETASDFGVKSAAVTGLFASQNALHPGDDFVRRRVRRLVKIDDTA